jgi:hypothetical protein
LWDTLCGWYAPDAGPTTNLFTRVGFGAGLEATVRKHRLCLTPLTPVPALRKPMPLHPDDPDDPHVFRVELLGYDKTMRVVFTADTPPRLLIEAMSFVKRPDWQNPRRWAAAAAAVGAAGAVAWRVGGRG